MSAAEEISIAEASRRSGVDVETLERWADSGMIQLDGEWTAASAAQARIAARMEQRGYSSSDIRAAARDGRLAFGYVEDLLPDSGPTRSRREVAEAIGLDDELVERIITLLGTPTATADRLSTDDVEALRVLKRILDAGFPLVALLQLVRVYAQSLRKVAEAEVRLFHLFVHEPLISDGVPALEMAEEMGDLAEDLMPAVSPLLEYVHSRYLRFYVEQDVVGHMETDLPLGRRHPDYVQMSFCFVDLTGFTRFTEEAGDLEALDLIERFVEGVEASLPADATIVKTIGDEVMIVSPETSELVEWAVGFLELFQERPRPRAGIHLGRAVYRDGDYFGGDVNLAHRLVARTMAGEVMVTEAVVDAVGSSNFVAFDSLGDVSLKGFPEPIELFLATRA